MSSMATKKKKKKGKKAAPMPAMSAGLIRFYDEDLPGPKIGPIAVLIAASSLIAIVILAHLL